ncbi:MAG: S41 family peptidase [Minisyncoccia bacterium]
MSDDFTSETEQVSYPFRVVKSAIAAAVIAIVFFVGGLYAGKHAEANILGNIPLLSDGLNATPDQNADLTDFWKTWNALDAKFVKTHASSSIPTAEEKIWGAIQGLASSYGDPYTVFMPPEDAKVFQENISGNFEGVGMEIGIGKNNILTVIAPLKNTPAERAGMKPGDEIIAINDKSTEGMSTDAAVKIIRGPKGTTVSFKVLREGELLTIDVVRDTIAVPEMDNSFDAKTGVYSIALYEFSANAGELFDAALVDFRNSGSRKLIIDLRGDPGGYLDAAVDIASHFLPKGAAVVTEDYEGKQESLVHRSQGTGGIPPGTTVVVLIDEGSASASEILAGALQDHDVATLIGTRSFGKGSVQELVNVNGGSLKVTVARWLTPSGKNIAEGGLAADIKIERTAKDFTDGKDPQKDRAVQFLTTGK